MSVYVSVKYGNVCSYTVDACIVYNMHYVVK